MSEKTAKEIAFLREHYVAPDWSLRFSELVDEHIKLPSEGKFLYVEAGTGDHALVLRKKLAKDIEMFATDAHGDALNIASDKAIAVRADINFEKSSPLNLTFARGEFSGVLADASFIKPESLGDVLAELVRVAEQDAPIAFFLPTAGSFGEVFSILWETLFNAQLPEHGGGIEELINELPTVEAAKKTAFHAGIDRIQSWTNLELFEFDSAAEFMAAPLVAEFLLPEWMKRLPAEVREKVGNTIEQTIDNDRSGMSFRFSVKATLITGKKSANY